MQEYVSEGIVLNKEPVRDFDGRYAVFTKRFGKVIGKTTSSRKITSKLAGHLEPGTLSKVRFVEKSGTRIVDALKEHKLDVPISDLRLLNSILHEGGEDQELWEILTTRSFSWNDVLRVLGWDPRGARCEACSARSAYFYIPRQEFFCTPCASKLKQDALILLNNAEV
jgi:recombinational DNA repair protein (RecF pathway)